MKGSDMMRGLRRLSHKAICALLLFLALHPRASPGGVPTVYATSSPDLIIWSLSFDPSAPLVWNAVTVTVRVNNTGADPSTDGTTVSLEWRCGHLSRLIDPLAVGEFAVVEFKDSLVFTEPGDYKITVMVDPENRIFEEDENNNVKTEWLHVALRVEADPEGEPREWDWEGEPLPLHCPDNDLMTIGRRGPPYERVDGRLERFNETATLDEMCDFGGNPLTDEGCRVYLPGQRPNQCGTVCLAYIMRYFGITCCGDHEEAEPDCIDGEIRARWGGVLGVDMYTEPIGIKKYAESRGLNAEVYVDGDLEEVRWFVDRGIPVMLDICTFGGSTDIKDDGHWVVVVSFCEVPQEFPAGTTKTLIGIYCPHGRQFAITPERLEQFWGRMDLQEIDFHLWDRLYIAISDTQALPPGNADKVQDELAMARGISTFMSGLDDLTEGHLLDGLVRVGGGIAVALGAAMSILYGWLGDNVPLIGGMFSSFGEFYGRLVLELDDVINSFADLLNPENWTWEDLERILENLAGTVLDVLEAVVEFIMDFLVDGIGGFFVDLWNVVTAISCSAINLGCPSRVVYYQHYVSTDPCLETTIFMNGLHRAEAIGYIYTYSALGTKPIWLYTDSNSLPSDRAYYLRDDGDWQHTNRSIVNLGMIGYSRVSPISGDSVNLTDTALNAGMFGGGDLGYLLTLPEPGTTILWRMVPLEESELEGWFSLGDNPTVSTDPCAMTQTFVTPVLQGYTRELVVGLIPPSETEGAVELYRFFNASHEDCLLSTSITQDEGYVLQGRLGYIYTQPGTDRVPLYQFYNRIRKDHLITTDPEPEGLDGYDDDSRELLGYILSTSNLEPEDWTCNSPLWRYCKRIYR
jgi:hypothetical protein